MNETIDNQQETLKAYYGGLMDGEGHFGISYLKNNNEYRAMVTFTNTDVVLVDKITDFLKQNNISFHVHTDKREGNKDCYQVQVTALDSKKRFLELIIPVLQGAKKHEASLVYKFVMSRIDRNSKKEYERNNLGRFMDNKKACFDETDVNFYQDYKKLKGSSETLCQALRQ